MFKFLLHIVVNSKEKPKYHCIKDRTLIELQQEQVNYIYSSYYFCS